MTSESIAKKVYDANTGSKSPVVLPEGIIGRSITFHVNGIPVNHAIVFSDGSELTISLSGDIFWTPAGDWKKDSYIFGGEQSIFSLAYRKLLNLSIWPCQKLSICQSRSCK
jgi:hypothetical protein